MEERNYKNPARWTPRTLRDEIREKGRGERDLPLLAEGRAANDHPVKHGLPMRVDEVEGDTHFLCGCGRSVPAFALVDVTRIPASVRGKQRWACDACWSAWLRDRKLTRVGWLRALGAPARVVADHEERIRKGGSPYLP